MDSDAKELGHVRVASSKDRLGLLSAVCDPTFLALATGTPNENLPMMRMLISRSQSTPCGSASVTAIYRLHSMPLGARAFAPPRASPGTSYNFK